MHELICQPAYQEPVYQESLLKTATKVFINVRLTPAKAAFFRDRVQPQVRTLTSGAASYLNMTLTGTGGDK